MRADVLSQRIFTAGCFGLPWLWVVHVLYERGLDEAGNSENNEDPTNQGLLDADERTLLCFGLLCFLCLVAAALASVDAGEVVHGFLECFMCFLLISQSDFFFIILGPLLVLSSPFTK